MIVHSNKAAALRTQLINVTQSPPCFYFHANFELLDRIRHSPLHIKVEKLTQTQILHEFDTLD